MSKCKIPECTSVKTVSSSRDEIYQALSPLNSWGQRSHEKMCTEREGLGMRLVFAPAEAIFNRIPSCFRVYELLPCK